MNDKKKIDRLFQERFKDFEAVPDDKIWDNIHDALHEKKKRRIITLWWKLSGIAAGFVLAFLVFNTFSNSLSLDEKPAVVVAPKDIESTDSNVNNTTPKNETRLVIENEEASLNENNLNSTLKTEDKIATDNTKSVINENDSDGNLNQNSQNKTNVVNKVSTKKQKNQASENAALANNSKKDSKENLIEKKATSKESIVFDSSNEKLNKNTPFVGNQNNLNKTDGAILSENNSSNKNQVTKNTDSIALALASETNPLEEILKKKNEKGEGVLATGKLNRWQVTTNVAPVYFNSASNGSPIESQFAENSKTYENNLSVGVGVQYAINKKVSVRTGVNKVTLGYGTNDVMFFGTLNSPGFGTLSSNGKTSNVEVISSTNFDGLRPFEDNIENMESGVLNQQMGYYEVPLELSYAIVNRKFGVHLIGGVSTLFLNENSISVQSASTKMSLGKANNLNDIHFSSNIGLGLKYEFWKSFEAHFEPTFKYQINTFSRDAGNFKPYFIGLYTGVSFKF